MFDQLHSSASSADSSADANVLARTKAGSLEVFDIIDDWVADPGAHLSTAIAYLLSAGRRPGSSIAGDLMTACIYVERARKWIARGGQCASWRQDAVPSIDARRVVVAFGLTPDLALALGGIANALAGPTFVDHWLVLALDALDRERARGVLAGAHPPQKAAAPLAPADLVSAA